MYKYKKKKRKIPPSWVNSYLLYYNGAQPREQRAWTEPYVQVAAIDPGEKNLAIRVERRYYATSSTPVKLEPILYYDYNVTGQNMAGTLINIITLLNNINPQLAGCHVLIIERQLFTKNPDASRIFQHILTWLLCFVSTSTLMPDIYEVDPIWIKQMMSLVIGKGKGNKTIMPYRVRALFYNYGDIVSWQILSQTGKKDDKADVAAMCESIARTFGLPYIIDPGTFVVWDNLDTIKTWVHLGVR